MPISPDSFLLPSWTAKECPVAGSNPCGNGAQYNGAGGGKQREIVRGEVARSAQRASPKRGFRPQGLFGSRFLRIPHVRCNRSGLGPTGPAGGLAIHRELRIHVLVFGAAIEEPNGVGREFAMPATCPIQRTAAVRAVVVHEAIHGAFIKNGKSRRRSALLAFQHLLAK